MQSPLTSWVQVTTRHIGRHIHCTHANSKLGPEQSICASVAGTDCSLCQAGNDMAAIFTHKHATHQHAALDQTTRCPYTQLKCQEGKQQRWTIQYCGPNRTKLMLTHQAQQGLCHWQQQQSLRGQLHRRRQTAKCRRTAEQHSSTDFGTCPQLQIERDQACLHAELCPHLCCNGSIQPP